MIYGYHLQQYTQILAIRHKTTNCFVLIWVTRAQA
jgi:hypothetical protein